MSLATLFTPIRSPADMEWFLAANESLHLQANRAILVQKAKQIISLPLRPLVPNDAAGWLARHFVWHTAINAALGTAGNDLAVVDFQDPEALAQWSWLHGTEHRNWNAALGI